MFGCIGRFLPLMGRCSILPRRARVRVSDRRVSLKYPFTSSEAADGPEEHLRLWGKIAGSAGEQMFSEVLQTLAVQEWEDALVSSSSSSRRSVIPGASYLTFFFTSSQNIFVGVLVLLLPASGSFSTPGNYATREKMKGTNAEVCFKGRKDAERPSVLFSTALSCSALSSPPSEG